MDTSILATEQVLVSTLVQLIVIILCARLAGNAARALRQPRVVGEVIAGLLLGPTLFGYLLPDLSSAIFSADGAMPMLVLSQIGLILLMFQIGSEFEFGHLRQAQNKHAVLSIAVASIGVPLVTGLLLGWWTAPVLAPGIDPLTYSLFVGVAFSITAVPVLGRILREYALTRAETGVIAITVMADNDVPPEAKKLSPPETVGTPRASQQAPRTASSVAPEPPPTCTARPWGAPTAQAPGAARGSRQEAIRAPSSIDTTRFGRGWASTTWRKRRTPSSGLSDHRSAPVATGSFPVRHPSHATLIQRAEPSIHDIRAATVLVARPLSRHTPRLFHKECQLWRGNADDI